MVFINENDLKLQRPLSSDRQVVKINDDSTGLLLKDNRVFVEEQPTEENEVATKKYVENPTSNVSISGNLTTTGAITSSNGVSQGKYVTDIKLVGYNSASAGQSYLPMNGYIVERTSTASSNEYIAFIAPYNGTLEKIMWRSEIAQDGTFRNIIYESSDGTEVPGTISGRWDPVVDVADDITVTFDYNATPTVGTNVLTKGRIYALSIDPVSAPYDTNATVVFKWDITT